MKRSRNLPQPAQHSNSSVQNNTPKKGAALPAVAPLQFAGFGAHVAPAEQTAVSVITGVTGLKVGDVKLPFNSGIGSATERATQIGAEIDNTTVSSAKREDDKNQLSKITGMARDEAFILLGVDPQKFYDAGHLVGDQLLKKLGPKYSFVPKNLAPQTSAFNSPAYANIMEEPIKAAAEAGKTIDMQVALEYPKSYTVPLSTILNRGVVEDEKYTIDETTGTAKIGDRVLKLDTPLTFPRRIPKKWSLTAAVKSGADTLPAFTQSKADKSVRRLVDAPDLDVKNLSLKIPYKYSVEGIDMSNLTVVVDTTPVTISFAEVRSRILKARQWKPPVESKLNKHELAGALNYFFPNVEDEELGEFFGIVKKDDFNSLRYMTRGMMLSMTEIAGSDISFDELNLFGQRLFVEMNKAEESYAKQDDAQLKIHLHNARAALDDFRETTAALVEASDKIKDHIGIKLSHVSAASQQLNSRMLPLMGKLSPSFNQTGLAKQMQLNGYIMNATAAMWGKNLTSVLENLVQAEKLLKECFADLELERQRIEREATKKRPLEPPLMLTNTPFNPLMGLPQTSLTLDQDTPVQQPPEKKIRLDNEKKDDNPSQTS